MAANQGVAAGVSNFGSGFQGKTEVSSHPVKQQPWHLSQSDSLRCLREGEEAQKKCCYYSLPYCAFILEFSVISLFTEIWSVCWIKAPTLSPESTPARSKRIEEPCRSGGGWCKLPPPMKPDASWKRGHVKTSREWRDIFRAALVGEVDQRERASLKGLSPMSDAGRFVLFLTA